MIHGFDVNQDGYVDIILRNSHGGRKWDAWR